MEYDYSIDLSTCTTDRRHLACAVFTQANGSQASCLRSFYAGKRLAGILPAQFLRRHLACDPGEHMTHKGWHSRGYLPHFDRPHLLQFITFRLADALPVQALEQMRVDAMLKNEWERIKRIEEELDTGHGACYLRRAELAMMVQRALLHFDGQRYRQIAWVVMPNHLHTLIEVFDGYPQSQVVHSWKSYTAKEANRLLQRTGTFWNIEYFDRFIRDETHLFQVINYIHQNPVKAGLVKQAEAYPYSSAYAP
jgi:putative transposase